MQLLNATLSDLTEILPLVRAYHQYEGIELSDAVRKTAIAALINNENLGRIWKIRVQQKLIGYVAICFGFSIEFGGRDAFIDELFISETFRGQGYGHRVLLEVSQKAVELGVHALHLEVARDNNRAQKLYSTTGFTARNQFFLMSRSLSIK